MRNPIPIILLILGLLIAGYGLMKKNDSQATVDLGIAEIQVGKKDEAFMGYFILGGILAVAGIVLLMRGGKR